MRASAESRQHEVDSREGKKLQMVNQSKTPLAGGIDFPELSPKLTRGLIGICNDSSSGCRIQSIVNNKPAVRHGANIERPIIVTKGVVA